MVAIEVATYLLGGGHRGVEVEVFAIGEGVWHHRRLDVAGDTEVALDTLLGDGGLLELVVGRQQFLVGCLQFAVGLLQFLMGILQLLVGYLQSLGRAHADVDEDDECDDDDRGDDDEADQLLACLLHLEACFLLCLLHLQFVDMEEGVHLRQLSLRVVGIDRVVDDVHLIVHVCSLLIAPQSLVDLCALLPDTDELRLVAGALEQSHAAVIEGECLLEEPLFLTELATVVEPSLIEPAFLAGAALLYLVEHL